MKKQTGKKKLTLSKETVRNLADLEAREILGGGLTIPNSTDPPATTTASRIFSCPC